MILNIKHEWQLVRGVGILSALRLPVSGAVVLWLQKQNSKTLSAPTVNGVLRRIAGGKHGFTH